jgi:hypothetical protein
VGSSLFECTLPLAGGGYADQFVKTVFAGPVRISV